MRNSSLLVFCAFLSLVVLVGSGCEKKESAETTTPGAPAGKAGAPPPPNYTQSGQRMQAPPPGMKVAPAGGAK